MRAIDEVLASATDADAWNLNLRAGALHMRAEALLKWGHKQASLAATR
jgi:hypothetical protein